MRKKMDMYLNPADFEKEKNEFKNIRYLEIKFATIEKQPDKTYILKDEQGEKIAVVNRFSLNEKTRWKLDGLAEYKIDR